MTPDLKARDDNIKLKLTRNPSPAKCTGDKCLRDPPRLVPVKLKTRSSPRA